MSEQRAAIGWARGSADFDYQSYPRDHTWSFEQGKLAITRVVPHPRIAFEVRVESAA